MNLILRCESPYLCSPYSSFKKVNKNDRIRILGNCRFGCSGQESLIYSYKIFKSDSLLNNWTDFTLDEEYFTGK